MKSGVSKVFSITKVLLTEKPMRSGVRDAGELLWVSTCSADRRRPTRELCMIPALNSELLFVRAA